MQVEIDQSGKIGDTKIATVLAFSNRISYSIYISAITKRKLVECLRTGENSRAFYFRLFAILIFILIKNFVNKMESIFIDQEYIGWEGQIKAYLIDIAQKEKINIYPDTVHFIRIGKKSNAHLKAIESLHKGSGDKIISYQEIASYFLPNKKGSGPLPLR